MAIQVTEWIIFGVMVATTLYNIWKGGFSVNKEWSRKVDLEKYNQDMADMNKELAKKVDEEDLRLMREDVFESIARDKEISQMELRYLKADLKKHEVDHTTLNKSIKDIEMSVQGICVNIAVMAEQMKQFNENKRQNGNSI